MPYDPAIPLLGIHTEETRRERDTCTPMFIAALFIARTWKDKDGQIPLLGGPKRSQTPRDRMQDGLRWVPGVGEGNEEFCLPQGSDNGLENYRRLQCNEMNAH